MLCCYFILFSLPICLISSYWAIFKITGYFLCHVQYISILMCLSKAFLFNWTYRGGICSPDHTGCKCTIQNIIICTLECTICTHIASSKVFFLPHFTPSLCSPPPTPHLPFPLDITLCLCVSCIYICLIPSPCSFHVPNPSRLWQASVCFMCACLFPPILFVSYVH